jgi:hypothetical protein
MPAAAAFVAVALVSTIGIGVLMGIGILNGPGSSGVDPPSPSPSVSPSSSAPSPAHRAPVHRPLTAGTHTAGFFWPQLTFTVPAGFFSDGDSPGFFGLVPDTPESIQGIQESGVPPAFLNVFRDLSVATDDCSEAADPAVGNTADEIVRAMAARQGLSTSEPAPVAIGGLSGHRIDFALAPDWTGTCPAAGGPFVPLLYEPDLLWWGAGPGEQWRIIVLDIPGDHAGTVTILVWSLHSAAWDAHLSTSMQIIDSFEFDLESPYPGAWGVCGNGAPSCAGGLSVGEHRSIAFEPAFTYRTPAGWLNPIDINGVFEVFPDSPAISSNPYIEILSNVSIPAQDAGCPTGPDVSPGTSVRDWVDYVATHPGLDTSTPTPVQIGGASGQSIDLSIEGDWAELCPAFPLIWSHELAQPAQFGIDPDRQMRLTILDVRGRTVLIAIYGPIRTTAESFAAAISELQPFIDSIDFAVTP